MVLPVLVGVGRCTQRPPERLEDALDPIALSAQSTVEALRDAGVSGDAVDAIYFVDMLGEQRLPGFPKSARAWPNPAASLGRAVPGLEKVAPERRFRSEIGGHIPQFLVNEAAAHIAQGDFDCAVVTGAEAIDTLMRALKQGFELSPDAATSTEDKVLRWGDATDHGEPVRVGSKARIVSVEDLIAGTVDMPAAYGLLEQALRLADGVSEAERRLGNGALFAGLSEVAARPGNAPHSWFPTERAAEEVATVSKANRMVSTPYPKLMCSIMDVSQAASVVLMSDAKARELGIPEEKWVYLHGCGDCNEVSPRMATRSDLARCPGLKAAGEGALAAAGVRPAEVAHFDIYSCFPVAVRMACRELGIDAVLDVERDAGRLTVTGGLPFHGGPGNNYSTHSIACMVERLRGDPGSFGLVTANGGVLSKHAAGVYSTKRFDEAARGPWRRPDCGVEVRRLAAAHPLREVCGNVGAEGCAGVVRYFTVAFAAHEKPVRVTALGDVTSGPHAGMRFLATSTSKDLIRELGSRSDIGDGTLLVGRQVRLKSKPGAFGNDKLIQTTFHTDEAAAAKL